MDKRCCPLVYIFLITTVFGVNQKAFAQDIKRGLWNGQEIDYVDRQVCVKMVDGASQSDIIPLANSFGATFLSSFDILRWAVIELPEGTDIFPVLEGFLASTLIENAEPRMVGNIGYDPNDPYYLGTLRSPDDYEHQWGVWNFGQTPHPQAL